MIGGESLLPKFDIDGNESKKQKILNEEKNNLQKA